MVRSFAPKINNFCVEMRFVVSFHPQQAMNKFKLIAVFLLGFSLIGQAQDSTAQPKKSKLGGFLNKVNQAIGNSGGLSQDEIARGLKEALSVGINNGSSKASALDGYFRNEAIKLLFPPEAQKVEATLRKLGLGKECDRFVLSLNRAAEDAAKKAAPIFLDAITKMTIQDAVGILRGEKNAATLYLKRTSTEALTNAFRPVVDSSLSKTNATKYYFDLATTYNKIPLVKDKVNPDLKGYATQKAIDGLFLLVADEEKKIRENPQARVSELLKKVFGSK
jgi:hypothetical protein